MNQMKMGRPSGLAERYADAEQCECGALLELVDSGNGHLYWAHVKRMRIEYDHAAVPAELTVGKLMAERDALLSKVRKIEALADRYAKSTDVIERRWVADSIRTLLAD